MKIVHTAGVNPVGCADGVDQRLKLRLRLRAGLRLEHSLFARLQFGAGQPEQFLFRRNRGGYETPPRRK